MKPIGGLVILNSQIFLMIWIPRQRVGDIKIICSYKLIVILLDFVKISKVEKKIFDLYRAYEGKEPVFDHKH